MKKSKKIQSFVGIDVSKLTIDACVLCSDGIPAHEQFENSVKGFIQFRKWLGNKDFFSEKKIVVLHGTHGLVYAPTGIISFTMGLQYLDGISLASEKKHGYDTRKK